MMPNDIEMSNDSPNEITSEIICLLQNYYLRVYQKKLAKRLLSPEMLNDLINCKML